MFNENQNLKNDTRLKRRQLTKHKMEKRREGVISFYSRAGHVEWDYIDGVLCPVGKYVKIKSRSNSQRRIKKTTNHRMRHANNLSSKGNQYRCLYDIWNVY